MVEDSFPLISSNITRSFYERVKKADIVIVYGAGFVSGITCRLLDRIGRNDYCIAVTKRETDSVREISEFRGRPALVLIAATREKQKEMVECAVSLGLSNYICMV